MEIMKRHTVLLMALVFIFSAQGCYVRSDEQILRGEFGIPASAKTILLEASPEKGEWFGREGLRISAAFQFDDADFQRYRIEAEKCGNWKPLPVPRDFLMRMGGIKTTKERSLRTYREVAKTVPEEGSVYNPTENQLYERFRSQLPLDTENGIYQCRAAGDDIMHKPKVIYTSLQNDLNDFMFAVLDTDKQVLRIRVSASY